MKKTKPRMTGFQVIRLADGETMAVVNRRQEVDRDCASIVRMIEANPGIPSKRAIAEALGLSVERVGFCIKYINSNATPFQRVDYGENVAKGGPYAGQRVKGWWPVRLSAYQNTLNEADKHAARVVLGVRLGQIDRLVFAHGLTTEAGRQAVATIEARLGVNVELLSETDYDTFVELLTEYLTANGSTRE